MMMIINKYFKKDETLRSLRMLTTQGRLMSPTVNPNLQAGLFDLSAYEFISVGNTLYEVCTSHYGYSREAVLGNVVNQPGERECYRCNPQRIGESGIRS